MILRDTELKLSMTLEELHGTPFNRFANLLQAQANLIPTKFAITHSGDGLECLVSGFEFKDAPLDDGISVFDFALRKCENADKFNTVFLVPTGIGAEIGGHAGDATPVARLLAEACDTLILHPNVVNASDLNEMPNNSLYVEGSVITRLLMGTVGLTPVRSNRVLVVIDAEAEEMFLNAAVNAVNAARTSFGLNCPKIVHLSSMEMRTSFNKCGGASGQIAGIENLFRLLEEERGSYDAVAISSQILVPYEFHQEYFDAGGDMVNPWGGVEAMLTHAVSQRFNVPSAHAPMLEDPEIVYNPPGVVDPRMAAEAISTAFFHSVLKGLHRSPAIAESGSAQSLSASDVSCLVIPDGCIGLPVLAAIRQGIKVIAVRENKNLMRNDLTTLPWQSGQLHIVDNYWEAAGVLCAIRGGILPSSVRRPIEQVPIDRQESSGVNREQDLEKPLA